MCNFPFRSFDREFGLSSDFVRVGSRSFSPDLALFRGGPDDDAFAFYYRVRWNSDTEIPRVFRQIQLTPSFHGVYAPAFATLMPENDGVDDFFEWGEIDANDSSLPRVLFLRQGIQREDIVNLISELLLRLTFVVDFDCTARSFARLDRLAFRPGGYADLENVFYSRYVTSLGRLTRVGRRLDPVDRALARNRLRLYQTRREDELRWCRESENRRGIVLVRETPEEYIRLRNTPSMDVVGTPRGDAIEARRGSPVHYGGISDSTEDEHSDQ